MTKIKEIMTKNVLTLSQETALMEVIKVMAETKISCVIVTDELNNVVGMITERLLIKHVLLPGKDPKKMKTKDVMVTNIVTAQPDTFLHDASQIMKERNIRHLPIVQDGKLCGLVTQTDIVRETHSISKKNVQFMTYQNIQTIVIIVLFIFLIIFVIWKWYVNS